MSNKVMEYWTNFAKTGNPNGDGLVPWPLDAAGNEENALWFQGGGLDSETDDLIFFGEMDENDAVNAVASFYAPQFNP
jgi:hypothetical protein